jgi:YHS domain-containing protein
MMIASKFAMKDPVCGKRVDEATAFRAERDGEMLFFCSSDCRQAFLSTSAGETTEAKEDKPWVAIRGFRGSAHP